MKNYIGISRDHSGSMQGLRHAAMRDYNDNVNAVRDAAGLEGIDTIVSTVMFGTPKHIEREVVNSSINALAPITRYDTHGSTPLFDSVHELIDIFEQVPDVNDPEVTFLIMVITDGEENASKDRNGIRLVERMRKLAATDRWSFTFRVPRGYGRRLAQFGIPGGNIMEWDQTEKGLAKASEVTRTAVRSFYSGRTKGVRSTSTFYANLTDVKPEDIQRQLIDVTSEVNIWENVGSVSRIDDFFNAHVAGGYVAGKGFYQLDKTEKAVQDYKKIVLRDRNTNKVYAGDASRQMLGLPDYGTVSLKPGDHKNYDIFIQSTSQNRNVPTGSKVLYWENVR